MLDKISMTEFNQMLQDPDVPDSIIAKYLVPAEMGPAGFSPEFVPNPELVERDTAESAMTVGNWICRHRRRGKFRRRMKRGVRLPVVVSEGDSWFQFPFLVDDVIDHLKDDYLAWSCGAAGDTAKNMIFDNPEYMTALSEQADHVTAFLFSAAGNDVIGEDEDGEPVLKALLHSRKKNRNTVEKLVNKTALRRVLDELRDSYMTVVRTVRADDRFEKLPILVHGYDYALPYPASNSDKRNPIYADNDKWLGAPMSDRGINNAQLRRDIVEYLIDKLYDMLESVAATDEHVHVVDVRRTLKNVGSWNDEIHGTDAGFKKVAAKFLTVLDRVVVPKPTSTPESALEDMPAEQKGPELFINTRTEEKVDPATLGFAEISKVADGFQRTQERIVRRSEPELAVGLDDSLPFRFLLQSAERGRAVCKIMAEGVNFRGQAGRWNGSGFLVAPNILLTNHHVINNPDVAKTAKAVFDYHEENPGIMAASSVYTFDPERLFISSDFNDLDYCFVWVNGNPQEKYNTVPLWRGSFMAAPDANANVIHHPNGLPKRCSIKQNKVIELGFEEVLVHYASDTEPGSSGSPVFNDEWRLFALHHASTMDLSPQQRKNIASHLKEESPHLNEGIKTSAIAVDIDTRASSGPNRAMARQIQPHFAGTDSRTGFFGTLGRGGDGSGNGMEVVIDAYRGAPCDIDVAFWNVEWFNRNFETKADDVARIVADLNLDIWAFEETSPEATKFLVEKLSKEFGFEFEYAASEPDAPSGRQTTTVMWNKNTVAGKRLDWPENIDHILKLYSDDPEAQRFEAVEGKIFNRYPGLFRFEALNLAAGAPNFDFNLIPVHMKAMGEGAKRRRMASKVLAEAIALTTGTDVAEKDWIIGGDFNAELATGEFDGLSSAGFTPMSAADERGGAITYLGQRYKSLIDSIFLSPDLTRMTKPDDFMILARDRVDPGFIDRVSDHRPVMLRLSICEGPASDNLPTSNECPVSLDDKELFEKFLKRMREDPSSVLEEMAKIVEKG